MSGPQIWLCLFTFRPYCVETVKWLDYNRYSQLTRWCSGNASALGARRSGFNPRLRQGFLCLIFLYCCCCVFTFLSKNTLFIGIYCNSFYNVILFSILNVLQDLWPIIRVKRYRPSIFNSEYREKDVDKLFVCIPFYSDSNTTYCNIHPFSQIVSVLR